MRRNIDYSQPKQYRQHKYQQIDVNKKTLMRRKKNCMDISNYKKKKKSDTRKFGHG